MTKKREQPKSPRVIYAADDLRVVLRSTDRWPEGYVEIERMNRDGLGNPRWDALDGVSLNADKQTGHPAIVLFIHLMRARCPEFQESQS